MGQWYLLNYNLEFLLLIGIKETLQTLFDHGSEFINAGNKIPFSSFLIDLLCSYTWTVESIRLLIRRGAEPGLYVQRWGGCLTLAIHGSEMESLEGLRDALILLITNGADVYARDNVGRSVTDIAYDAKTRWDHDGYRMDLNCHLQLRNIWTDALAASGYDVEEVVRKSLQVAELSDSDGNMDEDEDGHAISEDKDEDNDNTRQNDEYITRMQIPEVTLNSPNNFVALKNCSFRKNSIDDYSREKTGSVVHGHFDWSLLEEDTNIWRT